MSGFFRDWLEGALFLALAVPISGCSSPGSVYIHPNADFSTIQRIAILPLQNMTADRFAGDRVREVLTVEILSQGAFDVAESGEVNRVVRESGLDDPSALGPVEFGRLGRQLKVQALLVGTVMDYGQRRTGSFTAPEIALSLRLIDAESGLVVWSVTDARTGLSFWTRLFGVGEESQAEAVRELVRELLPTLFETAS